MDFTVKEETMRAPGGVADYEKDDHGGSTQASQTDLFPSLQAYHHNRLRRGKAGVAPSPKQEESEIKVKTEEPAAQPLAGVAPSPKQDDMIKVKTEPGVRGSSCTEG